MNTTKVFMKMLRAATLLALLLAACTPKNEIQGTDGQALIEQGDLYMTCLKESDWECAYVLMSPSAQQQVDQAIKLASGAVNLKSLFRTAGFAISKWTFEKAQFTTRGGTTTGSLQGKVEFMNGKQAQVELEFEKNDEIWMAQLQHGRNHPWVKKIDPSTYPQNPPGARCAWRVSYLYIR